MNQKVVIVIIIVIVVIFLAWALSASSGGKACALSSGATGKKNISGSKTWLSSEPALGAPESQMEHTELEKMRSPLYPMRQIVDQLLLAEGHCADQRARCYECLAKHMMTIEAWADFGCLLAGGATDDYSKIAQSVSEKLTEVRRLGMLRSRMGPWAKSLSDKIAAAYPNLNIDYNQLQDFEVEEREVPLLPLRLPLFNLREIFKLLILMEIVSAHTHLRCLECLRYLMTKAAALAQEGSEMSPSARPEYEKLRDSLNDKLAEILQGGLTEQTSQWFRAERKRLNEAFPELHEQGLYKDYEKPRYLATCGKTCS